MTVRTFNYRHLKTSGLAVVTIAGKHHYLGASDSVEGHDKYRSMISQAAPGARIDSAPLIKAVMKG